MRDLLRALVWPTALGCLALCALASSPVPADAATLGDAFSLSPYWDWKTIETENFRLTFPKELSPQAQRVAELYEQAHRALSAELHWSPRQKTQVLLIDHTDTANGLASPVSRLGMILYLTPPDAWFSTNYYDDWLKLLVFHEYTHYLNMDTTTGLYTVFRALFGDVLLPNSLWPTWMLEGLAVYMETKYTTQGRGRSPYYEMVLRSLVEAGTLGKSAGITLDRVNGTNPRFPGGETPYLFGYQLMNEVGKSRTGALGEMSYRSAGRFPYFINGNLENITGKDWYDFWDEFVKKTYARAGADLARIREAGETKWQAIDGTKYESLGSAVSPNEQWLAYSAESADDWQRLYLKNLKTGETETIEDKFFGSTMAFTPDSKTLVYSSLRRKKNYYFLSDLRAYDVATGRTTWLSDGARARDPDVSRDGKWIVFTVAAKSGVHLALGKLRNSGGRIAIEARKVIVEVPMFDRISNPKFSLDQKSVVFSLKRNGTVGESIARYDFTSGKTETLVSDGANNRFPAFDRQGTLHYVSDRTGVDNLYRFDGKNSAQMTNFTGGLWLPVFGSKLAYGSVYSAQGWSIATFEPSVRPYESARVTISKAPAPEPVETTPPEPKSYAVEDYSIFPSILPRQWAPLLFVSARDGYYVGAQAFGYDAVMRHQYLAAAAYDTEFKEFDHLVLYSNRSFGPTLDLYTSRQTGGRLLATESLSGELEHKVKVEAGASLSFPFQFTVATLTPTLSASLERDHYYKGIGSNKTLLSKSRYVPVQDATVVYSNTRRSRLSVTGETGRRILIGARRYQDSELVNYKGILRHTEYWNLGNHWVLSPTLRAIKVSKLNVRYLDANAVVTGKEDRIFNPLPGDNFDEFAIRGYPGITAFARSIYSGALDLNFPVAQIFRGWGTNPVFLNQLTMNVFGEYTYVPDFRGEFRRLASAGAGLRLTSDWLLHLPLTFAYDYHHGFNERLGESESFFSMNFVAALPF